MIYNSNNHNYNLFKIGSIVNFNLNKLDITDPLIDAYLDEKILDKKSHQSNNNDLPFMRDNNLTNYNHQLKFTPFYN